MKLVIVITVACFMFCFFSAQSNAESDINKNINTNAATHYLKAVDLLKNFKSDEIKVMVKKIKERGWSEYERAIEALIRENKPCLEEIKKGLPLPKCDFYFGKKDTRAFLKEIPASPKLLSLPWVLLLNGLYREHQMNYDEAMDFYLESLTFASQIAQDKEIFFRIIVVETEKNAYSLINEYIKSKNADRKLSRKIADYLVEYEKNHYRAGEMMETFKDNYLSAVQMLCEELKKKVASDNKYDEDMKKYFYNFSDILLQESSELANKYYGNFIKAADSNKDNDWKFAEDELNKFAKKALLDKISKVKDISAFVINSVTGKRIENATLLAGRISAVLLAVSSEGLKYRDGINRFYYNNHGTLKNLISLAKEHS